MFSQAFEIVLTIAHREATLPASCAPDARAPVYALAHDPDGESILAHAAPICRGCVRRSTST
jgi:hypothetical protein